MGGEGIRIGLTEELRTVLLILAVEIGVSSWL